MTERHEQVWVGIDAGKAHHWAAGVNASGEKVFSKKVVNGEDEILTLMVTACEMADEVQWAVDICGRASTLLLALLIAHGQSVVYVPARTVNRMSAAYRGEGKTDAKDATVIADTARMRQDFTPLSLPNETVANLQRLTAHRADLIADRVRLINRLRDALGGHLPCSGTGLRLLSSQGTGHPADRVPEPGRPAANRRQAARGLAGTAFGPQRG